MLLVGQARGVVLLAIEEAKLPVIEFTPNQVKQSRIMLRRSGKNLSSKNGKDDFKLKRNSNAG